jgi:hypothetical protein
MTTLPLLWSVIPVPRFCRFIQFMAKGRRTGERCLMNQERGMIPYVAPKTGGKQGKPFRKWLRIISTGIGTGVCKGWGKAWWIEVLTSDYESYHSLSWLLSSTGPSSIPKRKSLHGIKLGGYTIPPRRHTVSQT